MTRARASWRELAGVAAALLVPVPLLAAAALVFPLPAAIEHGVASLTPGGDTETAVVGVAPARSRPPPAVTFAASQHAARSDATPTVTRPPAPRAQPDEAPSRADSGADRPEAPGEDADAPAEPDGEGPPPTDDDEAPGGDTGGEGPPGPPAVDPVESPPPGPNGVEAHAGGASIEITAGADGVGVTTEGETDAAPDAFMPFPGLPLP